MMDRLCVTTERGYMMKRKLLCLLALLISLTTCAQADFSFPGVFLPEGEPDVRTETSYRSSDMSIEITAQRVESSDVYVADIYLREVTSLQRAFGGGEWDTRAMRVPDMAAECGAILAMTGDSAHVFTKGWLIGNGTVLRDNVNSQRDVCLIYRTGEMRTILAQNADLNWLIAEADKVWQAFCFGPALLDEDGKALKTFNSKVNPANPRSVIGYYEPGHYCFVQVDGRGAASALEPRRTSRGLTMAQLAAFMESLGCQAAYNLDGGQSSMLWFDGHLVSTPYNGGRSVGDIVIITEMLP